MYERSGAQHARKKADEAWGAARQARERAERLRRDLYEDDELYRQRGRGKETEPKGGRDALKEARERAEKLRRELREDEELYQQRTPGKESEAKDKTGEPRWKEKEEYTERRGGGFTGRNPGERPRRATHEKPPASDRGNNRQSPQQERKQAIPPPPDHYAILGIPPTATEAEILKAAKKKRIETHPDRFVGQNLAPSDAAKMIELSKNVGHAADILSDPKERKNYDIEVARWKAKEKTENARPTTNKTAHHRPTRAYSVYRDTKTFYESESDEDFSYSTDEGVEGGQQTHQKTRRPGASAEKPRYKPKFNSLRRPEGYEYRERPRNEDAINSRQPDSPDVVMEDVSDIDFNTERYRDGIFGPQASNSSDEDIVNGPE